MHSHGDSWSFERQFSEAEVGGQVHSQEKMSQEAKARNTRTHMGRRE